ncbi:unnamed protein product [Blepharisma stoltei]|uniref:Uncharacterized protein n=1 Tax=Blepharisma stoltei TaxID=1481888 RepID=A0AAU9JQL9_9CILI|nr:unnamed protein product [Blepharisma stoltei]
MDNLLSKKLRSGLNTTRPSSQQIVNQNMKTSSLNNSPRPDTTQARLKDLCAEDKTKIGLLVKKAALEKSQRVKSELRAAKELKRKENELKKYKKLNKELQEKAETIKSQLEKSEELLNKYKHISVSSIIQTPNSPQAFNQSLTREMIYQATPITKFLFPSHDEDSPQSIEADKILDKPGKIDEIIQHARIPSSPTNKSSILSSKHQQTLVLRETATSPIEVSSTKDYHSVLIQTVCDKEIQTQTKNQGEKIAKKISQETQSESINETRLKAQNKSKEKVMMPQNINGETRVKNISHMKEENTNASEKSSKENAIFQASESKGLELSFAPKNTIYEPRSKEPPLTSDELKPIDKLSQSKESISSKLNSLSASIKSPSSSFSLSNKLNSKYYNPLLTNTLDDSSKMHLSNLTDSKKFSDKLKSSSFKTKQSSHEDEKSQSFKLKDLGYTQKYPEKNHHRAIDDKVFDDNFFQLVEEIEKSDSSKFSISQLNSSSNHNKTDYLDSKMMSIIDELEMGDETMEYSVSSTSKKSHINKEQDSFEELKKRAYQLRESLRK